MKLEAIERAIEYFNGYGSPFDEIVIEALAKQLPQRVVEVIHDGQITGWTCPKCKIRLAHGKGKEYCPNCGQRIAWGGDDTND